MRARVPRTTPLRALDKLKNIGLVTRWIDAHDIAFGVSK
jgi:hypothetical protein